MNPLKWLKDRNYQSLWREKELLNQHTCLKLGGPADYFARPSSEEELGILLEFCKEFEQPLTLLGGGANVLVADKGIRGLVIQTSGLDSIERQGNTIIAGSGRDVTELSEFALNEGLSGLEWIYRMPGSFGGALWMNARCYGSEISKVFQWAKVMDLQGKTTTIPMNSHEWAYKKSPFQERKGIILKAAIQLYQGDLHQSKEEMEHIAKDRIAKGHFRKPSAGSTFKNNRDFGAPSGQIIDRCGLRSLQVGGAMVSPWHANILINENNASSQDFQDLIELVQDKVFRQTGFFLEPEVLPIGDWE